MKFTEFANIPSLDSKKIIADLKATKSGSIGAPLNDLEEWSIIIAENYDDMIKSKISAPLVGWLKRPDHSYALSFKNGMWNLTEFKKDFSAKTIGESEELVDIELRAKKTLKNFPSIPVQLEDALKKANVFESFRKSGKPIKESAEQQSFNHRSLRLIAKEIRADWKNITSSYAYPYYQALADSNKITDTYGADSVYGIVLYFLSNAAGWKGEKAREIKAELKKMCKDYEKLNGFKESLIREATDDHIYTIHDFTFTELLPGVFKLKPSKASGGPQHIINTFIRNISDSTRIEGVYDLAAYYTPTARDERGEYIKKAPVFKPVDARRLKNTLKPKTAYLIHAPGVDLDEVKKIFSLAIIKHEKGLEDYAEKRENRKELMVQQRKYDAEKRKNDKKELEAKYGKDVISRVKIRKYNGDDHYSWAVFVDGRPIITGLSQRSANFEKIQAYKSLSKNAPSRVTEEKTKDIKIADISKVYPLKRDGFIYGFDDEKFIVYTHSTPRGKPIFSIFKQWTQYVVRVLNRKEVRLDTLSEVLSYLNKQKIDKIVDKVPTDQSILKFLNKWVELPKNVKLTLDNIKELSFKPVDGGKVIEITHPDYDDYDEYFVFGEGEEEPTQKARYVVIGISEVGLTVDDLTKWLIKNKAKAVKK